MHLHKFTTGLRLENIISLNLILCGDLPPPANEIQLENIPENMWILGNIGNCNIHQISNFDEGNIQCYSYIIHTKSFVLRQGI